MFYALFLIMLLALPSTAVYNGLDQNLFKAFFCECFFKFLYPEKGEKFSEIHRIIASQNHRMVWAVNMQYPILTYIYFMFWKHIWIVLLNLKYIKLTDLGNLQLFCWTCNFHHQLINEKIDSTMSALLKVCLPEMNYKQKFL